MTDNFIDHIWYGPEPAILAAIQDQPNVIGPEIIDDVAYVTVRSTEQLPLPPGCATAGPQLGTRLLGVWMGDLPEVPQQVSLFQARAMLMNVPSSTPGRTLFDEVDDAMKAQGGVALQAWEYATVVLRNGPLVSSLAAMLGISEAAMDEMFIQAAQITI